MKKQLQTNNDILNAIFASPDNIVIVPSYFLEKNLTERWIKLSGQEVVLRPCFISYQYVYKHIYAFQRLLDAPISLEFDASTTPFFKKWCLMRIAFKEGASVDYVQSLIKDMKSAKKCYADPKLIDAVNSYLGIDMNRKAIDFLSSRLSKANALNKVFLFSPISRGVIETNIANNGDLREKTHVIGHDFDLVDIKSSISAINHRVFELTRKIELSESLNDTEEAKIISLQIQEMLHSELSNIAVVTNSKSLRRKIFLELEAVGISSNYSMKLVDTQEFQLILCMMQLAQDPNDHHALISILFSNLFTLNYEALGIDIYKQDLYVDEKDYLNKMIESNQGLQEFYNNIISTNQEKELAKFIKKIHCMFFQYSDLSQMAWQMKNKLICFCDDLLSAVESDRIYINNKDVISWIKFLASSEVIASHSNPTVQFYRLEDVDYMLLDRVILSDSEMIKAEKEVGDKNNLENISWYRYLNILQNCEVKITRSRKVAGVVSEKSLVYKILEQNNKFAKSARYNEICKALQNIECVKGVQPAAQLQNNYASTTYSVSAIEVLLRDPYSYYAKYILKLRKKDRFFDDVWARDFGILSHDIMSKIDLSKPLEDSLKICDAEAESTLSNQTLITKSYIKNRLYDFVTYVHNLFGNKSYVSHPEVNGSAILKISDEVRVTIQSRADRIVLDDELVHIIDFKTGTLPAEKQVNEGLFPQLAIEKWILENDGFPIDYVGKDLSTSFVLLKGISKNDHKIIKCNSENVERSLTSLLSMFLLDGMQYFATHNEHDVKIADYAHLRRFQEWFDT